MALKEISQHLEAKIETVQTQIQTLTEHQSPGRKVSKRRQQRATTSGDSLRNLGDVHDENLANLEIDTRRQPSGKKFIPVVTCEQDTQTTLDEPSRLYYEQTNLL